MATVSSTAQNQQDATTKVNVKRMMMRMATGNVMTKPEVCLHHSYHPQWGTEQKRLECVCGGRVWKHHRYMSCIMDVVQKDQPAREKH